MYTVYNYKTKKELKAALKEGKRVEVYQPNGDITGFAAPKDGKVYLEDPHYPASHSRYGTGTLKDGVLVEVK